MGRPAMSAEEIRNNKVSIIRAAMEMIRENGPASVSARSLGSRVGMNSALIYRYFKDIDEVILFACIHVLQEYTEEMSSARREYESTCSEASDEYIYLLSWELFSKHAFNNPEEYNILFFSKHSYSLKEAIKDYYLLFPHGRTEEDDIILEGMFQTANVRDRNLILLIPVLEGRKTDQEIIMINDMTVAYFFALLVQLIGNDQNVTPDYQIERIMRAVRYTISL